MRSFTHLFLAAAVAMASVAPAFAAKDDHGHEKKADKGHAHHGHGHAHEAPHGGTLVVFGDEFAHLEIVVDPADGKVNAYVLDGGAENAVRIKNRTLSLAIESKKKNAKTTSATIELKAVGSELTGEKEGDTSEFEGKSAALKDLKKFEATLNSIEIKGKVFKKVRFRFPEGNE